MTDSKQTDIKTVGTPYTLGDWTKDGTFRAKAGQEVDREIYNRMLEGVPPREVPGEVLSQYGCAKGFLMGEAYDMIGDRELYPAFGETDDGRLFYLGLSEAVDDPEGEVQRIPSNVSISKRPDCPKCHVRPIEVIGKLGETFVKCPKCGLSSWGFMSPREAHDHWDRLAAKGGPEN